MDSVKHFIGFFIKLSLAFFLAALILWLVSLMYPALSVKAIIARSRTSSTTDQGWLPSPRRFPSLLGKKVATPDENTNLFVAPPAFNGYNTMNGTANGGDYKYANYIYVSYDANGRVILTPENEITPQNARNTSNNAINNTRGTIPSSPSTTTDRNLLIRNLSIYDGGHIYTGLSFIGEARSSMFKNGRFPIIVVDQNGRLVGISAAVATTDWAVPGWTRFETRIDYVLPNNIPCALVFEEALTQNERAVRQPLRTHIPVRCN